VTTPKTYTLKKIKFAPWASEETYCFDAELVINNKSFGVVSNSGRGSCHSYEMSNTQQTGLNETLQTWAAHHMDEWMKNNELQPSTPASKEAAHYEALDMLVSELLYQHAMILEAKKLRGKTARRVKAKPTSFTVFASKTQMVCVPNTISTDKVEVMYPGFTALNLTPTIVA
jgi:hypothetical protein